MSNIASLAAFVDHAVRGLCDEPELVKMEEIEDEKGFLVSLTVPSSQMSKLIGRNGKTIKALTTLVRSMGQDLGQKCALKIIEIDENGEIVERARPERTKKPTPYREFAPENKKKAENTETEPTKSEAPEPNEEIGLSVDDIDI